MGLSGLEPPTSRLSGVRSNRLSYKPEGIINFEEIYDRNSNALVEFRRGAFRVAEVFHEATLLPARIEIGLKLKVFVEFRRGAFLVAEVFQEATDTRINLH